MLKGACSVRSISALTSVPPGTLGGSPVRASSVARTSMKALDVSGARIASIH